jgi:hypothetical protein
MAYAPNVSGMSDLRGVISHPSIHNNFRDLVEKKLYALVTLSLGFNTAYKCAWLGIIVTLL